LYLAHCTREEPSEERHPSKIPQFHLLSLLLSTLHDGISRCQQHVAFHTASNLHAANNQQHGYMFCISFLTFPSVLQASYSFLFVRNSRYLKA
jgi:hypothetical protein